MSAGVLWADDRDSLAIALERARIAGANAVLECLEAELLRHCHADGAGPCLAGDCPIAGQRPRACPGAAGPQHPAAPR